MDYERAKKDYGSRRRPRRLREPGWQALDLRLIADDKTGADDFFKQSQALRVAQLIDRLDDIVGGKNSIPGPLIFSFTPTYRLLLREGDGAVGALMETYAKR